VVLPATASGDDRRQVAPPVTLEPVPSEGGASAAIPAEYLAAYRRAGRAFDVDWRLLAAIGRLESRHGESELPGVQAGATASGAAGPAQLCVATACGAVWQTWQVDGDGDGAASVHDPDDAFATAARYVQWLTRQVGDEPSALLAAYNAGPGAVLEHGGVPPYPETRHYVDAGHRLLQAL
jgi:membrane-bound lytic murein transglycosylase B